jgi:hypothetical protein
MSAISKTLILIGVILILAGIIIHVAGNRINWIGHLPGDIRIEKENFRFYFPITTMVLASIILTGILWIVKKLF